MKRIAAVLLIVLLAVHLGADESIPPTMDQVEILYNEGKLEEALDAVNLYLAQNEGDPQAKQLKEGIELDLNLTRSRDLTTQALLLIDADEFKKARGLLGEALVADPGNTLAMELYVSLSDIVKAESIQEDIPKTDSTEDVTPVVAAGTAVVIAAAGSDEETGESDTSGSTESANPAGEENELESEEKTRSETPFGFSLGPRLTFANSNYLTLDSGITLLGVEADAWVFLPFWERRLGFSATYTGDLFKLSGSDAINFSTNRIKGLALIRTWLFDNGSSRTTIGGGIGYDFFALNNKETEGAYLIVNYAGPSISFFISDPVFARFLSGNFVNNLSFNLNIDGTISGGGSGTLFSLDLGFKASYYFGLLGIGLGYDFHGLYLGTTTETYNSIILTCDIAF